MTYNRSLGLILHISCRHIYCLTLNPKEIAFWMHLHLINDLFSNVIGASNVTQVLVATYILKQTMSEYRTEDIKGSDNFPRRFSVRYNCSPLCCSITGIISLGILLIPCPIVYYWSSIHKAYVRFNWDDWSISLWYTTGMFLFTEY